MPVDAARVGGSNPPGSASDFRELQHMFPIRDDNPHFLTPVTTLALIAVNALCWFYVQGLGGEPVLSASLCELGLIPAELLGNVLPGTQVSVGHGLSCVLGLTTGWYTMLSSMFLHGGWAA